MRKTGNALAINKVGAEDIIKSALSDLNLANSAERAFIKNGENTALYQFAVRARDNALIILCVMLDVDDRKKLLEALFESPIDKLNLNAASDAEFKGRVMAWSADKKVSLHRYIPYHNTVEFTIDPEF